MIESERIIIWDEPEYTASYHTTDLGDGQIMTFFHLDVYYMDHKILRQMERQWEIFRQQVPCVLFAMNDDETPAWIRLCARFGFQVLRTDVPCTDGKSRTLLVNYGPTLSGAQKQE